jgi:hypothetical protein
MFAAGSVFAFVASTFGSIAGVPAVVSIVNGVVLASTRNRIVLTCAFVVCVLVLALVWFVLLFITHAPFAK